MRIHRFYISEIIGDKTTITVESAELANQIRNVFRLKAGDSVVLFDGSGFDYECTILGLGQNDEDYVTFSIEKNAPSRFMPDRDGREITLCAAVVKKDTFEWIVEKATELGVSKIIPIMAERSEKKNLNEVRLKKIAIEASEQSGRGNVPMIHSIITLGECQKWITERKIPAIVFHTEGPLFGSSVLLDGLQEGRGEDSTIVSTFPKESASNNDALGIFIGPEGGWSNAEIELFHANNMPIFSLGPQVLRAETAVVSALSLILL